MGPGGVKTGSRVERYIYRNTKISDSYQEPGERHGTRHEILFQSLRRNGPC